jgi:hypothetical protein
MRYPLENEDAGALYAAHLRYKEILELPRRNLSRSVREEIAAKVPGVLQQSLGADTASQAGGMPNTAEKEEANV